MPKLFEGSCMFWYTNLMYPCSILFSLNDIFVCVNSYRLMQRSPLQQVTCVCTITQINEVLLC